MRGTATATGESRKPWMVVFGSGIPIAPGCLADFVKLNFECQTCSIRSLTDDLYISRIRQVNGGELLDAKTSRHTNSNKLHDFYGPLADNMST